MAVEPDLASRFFFEFCVTELADEISANSEPLADDASDFVSTSACARLTKYVLPEPVLMAESCRPLDSGFR